MLADTALARLPAAIQATTSAAVQEATSHAWCNGQWRSRKRQATHTKGLKVLVYTFSLVEHSQGKGPHSASSSVKTATQRVPNESMVAGAATLDRQPGSWKLPHARWVVAQSDLKAAWWKAKASLLPTGAGGSGRERVAGVPSNAVGSVWSNDTPSRQHMSAQAGACLEPFSLVVHGPNARGPNASRTSPWVRPSLLGEPPRWPRNRRGRKKAHQTTPPPNERLLTTGRKKHTTHEGTSGGTSLGSSELQKLHLSLPDAGLYRLPLRECIHPANGR